MNVIEVSIGCVSAEISYCLPQWRLRQNFNPVSHTHPEPNVPAA